MARDLIVDLVMNNLCELMETPAGPGEISGLVDRNGEVMALVDQGERLPGGVVVLRAVDGSRLNLAGAARVAREGTMESWPARERTMES